MHIKLCIKILNLVLSTVCNHGSLMPCANQTEHLTK